MRTFHLSILLVLGLTSPVLAKETKANSLAPAAAFDAEKLLEEAEFIRNPQENYVTSVYLEDTVKGKTTKNKYETFVKGRDKALVKFLEPAVDVGTRVLFVDNDMWIFVPSSAKPMRVSPRQKLAGNAAYGDVTRLNFVGNYTAKYLRQDTFEKRPAHVLDLTSIAGRPVTYDRIEYWLDKENKRPLRLIFKTISEKVIREATFDDFQQVFGVKRPNKFIIVDAIDRGHVTTLIFKDAKAKEFSDVIFQKQNLGRD